MVNNFSQINDLLVFDTEDDFYHLQILKRKKEHPELGSNSYVVKTYYIRSREYLNSKKEEIITLCNHHNARACINLNRRSFEKISYKLLEKVVNQISNKDFKSCRKAYESVCGSLSNEPYKKWIIDIDDKNFNESFLIDILNNITPYGSKFIYKLETKNGYHLITKPFNVQELREAIEIEQLDWNFDIQKDNPTILYIP